MTTKNLAQKLLSAYRQGVGEAQFPWGDGILVFAKDHDDVYTIWLQKNGKKIYQGIFSPGMFTSRRHAPLSFLPEDEAVEVVAEYLEVIRKEPWS